MDREKEEWTSQALNSLKGMQRAEPNTFLYTRIWNKIETGLNADMGSLVPVKRIWVLGFGLVLLLVMNIGALKISENHITKNNLANARSVYQIDNTNYELY